MIVVDNMRRIRLTIEYEGTHYAGWQRQLGALSVQQVVEGALHRLTGEAIGITGASRTDAGVHALGQVAHFDTASRIPPDKFCFALNTLLPPDVRVVASQACGGEGDEEFHARFSARGKLYRYAILNRRHASALLRNSHWHVPLKLDDERMRAALPDIIGTHDFAACMAAGGASKDTVRTMIDARLERVGDELIFYIEGSGFLYHMVRTLAGTLVYIGLGKLPVDAVRRALKTGDRLALGVTAPAQGLTLVRVYY